MEAGKLTDDIAEYYSAKVRSFGATSAGVDWNSADGRTAGESSLSRRQVHEEHSLCSDQPKAAAGPLRLD